MTKNLNIEDELNKIGKYKRKFEQSGGKSQYRLKLNEHKYKLSKMGYDEQDIERMMQSGGAGLEALATKANDALESVKTLDLCGDKIKTVFENTRNKEVALNTSLEELKNENTNLQKRLAQLTSEKENAEREKKEAINANTGQEDLQNEIDKLTKELKKANDEKGILEKKNEQLEQAKNAAEQTVKGIPDNIESSSNQIASTLDKVIASVKENKDCITPYITGGKLHSFL